MEDFDVFTNEIEFTKPFYKNVLNKYVKDIPSTPSGPNYQSGRKLFAEECLADNKEADCAFYLSESVSATLRTLAVYRDEQLRVPTDKAQKIAHYLKPNDDIIKPKPKSKAEEDILKFISKEADRTAEILRNFKLDEVELPFYKRYMRFTSENNTQNFLKILKELPKEWTIVQLTAPYNPNENLKPLNEYRCEIDSIYLSVFTNEYFDFNNIGPLTIEIPANIIKEGEKPLFTELYSLLDDNYKTIDNAQFLNNKRLVQNYWSRREDIDLRMKSVINIMDKEWIGGWSCLLSGKLLDKTLRDKVINLVDATISDWGFIKLTNKQRNLLYNLIDSCQSFTSQQIKSCIRRILTEHGNPEEIRTVLNTNECTTCAKQFRFLNELCLKCLSKSFEAIHHFSLVEGIKAFSQVANQVKENDDWATLRKAKRLPVILIVDEMLDTFPWEMLPIFHHQPVSRMENIHFTYALYKIHEKDFVDGYIASKTDVGRYIINPEKNLERMEKRMTSFVQYWCPEWEGSVGETPPEDFLRYLTESDVFLYCGHGDGCQLAGGAGGAGVEAAAVRGAALLSGCGSVRLQRPPGRAPPAAAHHHLHVAGSPMVVGMLWEVTDLEVDKVVSTLVSLYVPSKASVPWQAVGKAAWSQGKLEAAADRAGGARAASERDLLRAISLARAATGFALIASSVVARGLPVRVAE
ncbi:unnamed protein product, partial [Iphiclides podalirius]